MSQQKINLRPKGLYTNVNQLGTVPPGALSDTLNCVLSKPNIIGIRRGEESTKFFAALVAGTWQPLGYPLRLNNAKLRVGGSLATNFVGDLTPGMMAILSDGTIWWADEHDVPEMNFVQVSPTYGQGTIPITPAVPTSADSPPVALGGRSFYTFEAQQAYYLVTGQGVLRIGRPHPNFTVIPPPANPTADEISDWQKSGYSRAGVPFGGNASAVLGGVAGTAIAGLSQVAYRICFGFRDASNILHLGAPTTRFALANSNAVAGGTRDATVKTQIPPDLIPGKHFYQVYRTQGSSSNTVDPGDDCGLIAERPLPADLIVDQASRTGTTATLRTTANHGITTGEVVVLKSDIIGPTVAVNEEYFVEITATNARKLHKKVGPANTTAEVGAGAFNVTKETHAPAISNQILFVRDVANARMYYMESHSPYVYWFNAAGAYQGALSIGGYLPDLAIFDSGTQRIKMICRPAGASPTSFDYQSSNFYCIDFNPITGTIYSYGLSAPINTTYNVGGGGLTSTVLTGTVSSLYPPAKMGLWRASATSPLYWAVILHNWRSGVQVLLTADVGNTWTYQAARYPSRNYGSDSAKAWVTACDIIENATTKEVTTAFGVTTIDVAATPIAGDTNHATLHYITNDGNNQPRVYQGTIHQTNDATVFTQPPAILAIRFTRYQGVPYVMYVTPSGAPEARIPVVVALQGNYVASGAIVNTSGVTLGSTNLAAGYLVPRGYLFDTNAANNIVVGGIDIGNNMENYLIPSNAIPPNPTLLESFAASTYTVPAVTLAPPSAVAAIIKAQAYTLLSGSTNTMTLKSVQSPQVDFGATAVSGVLALAEITYNDVVAPGLLGPYLYTSPSVEGIGQANHPPPFCEDGTLFRTTAFYANAKQRTTLSIQMVKQPTSGQRIYLGGSSAVYLTGQNAAGGGESISDMQFLIGTDNSAAQMRITLESMARVINCNWRIFRCIAILSAFGPVAFATFTLTGILPSDTVTFKHTANDGVTMGLQTFTPDNLVGPSIKERNVLYYSKSNIPGAVPLLNSIRVGADTKEILRVFPTRDSLFIFKEEGAYVLRGYGPPWQVDPFDLTLRLSLRNSLAGLDNSVFGAFSRGVFKVTDSNAELLSLPVQDQLERQIAGNLKAFANEVAFGVGDNTDHKYLLWIPQSNDDEMPSKVLVWDTYTNEWTTWNQPARHAISHLDLALHYAGQTKANNPVATGGYASGYYPSILEERKDFTQDDFIGDNIWRIPDISTFDNKKFQIGYHDPTLGCVVLANQAVPSDQFTLGQDIQIITAPSPTEDSIGSEAGVWKLVIIGWGFEVSLNSLVAYYANTPADVTAHIGDGNIAWDCWIWKTIPHGFTFAQTFPESPMASNHFSEVALSFRENYFHALQVLFSLPGQEVGTDATSLVTVNAADHFWDGVRKYINDSTRTFVPRKYQRGSAIQVSTLMKAMGYNIETNGMSIVLTQGPTSFTRR